MAAVLTPEQQAFVTAEITRRLVSFSEAWTVSLQGEVADSAQLVTQQFLIEKEQISTDSKDFEARIVSTLNQTIYGRISVVTGPAAFVAENSEMRATVESLK